MAEEKKNLEQTAQTEKKDNPVVSFFKKFTGPKHPLIGIVVFDLIALALLPLSFIVGIKVILPLLYCGCMLIPLTYVRPLKISLWAKSIIAALISGALAAGVLLLLPSLPEMATFLLVIIYIVIWAVAHIIIFGLGLFAYKASFKTLGLAPIILLCASLLAEVIYEIGAALIYGSIAQAGTLSVLELLNMSRFGMYDIVFVGIRLVLLSLSVCFAAKAAQKKK